MRPDFMNFVMHRFVHSYYACPILPTYSVSYLNQISSQWIWMNENEGWWKIKPGNTTYFDSFRFPYPFCVKHPIVIHISRWSNQEKLSCTCHKNVSFHEVETQNYSHCSCFWEPKLIICKKKMDIYKKYIFKAVVNNGKWLIMLQMQILC